MLNYVLQLLHEELEDGFAELSNEQLAPFVSGFVVVGLVWDFFFSVNVLRTEIMHVFEFISSFYK